MATIRNLPVSMESSGRGGGVLCQELGSSLAGSEAEEGQNLGASHITEMTNPGATQGREGSESKRGRWVVRTQAGRGTGGHSEGSSSGNWASGKRRDGRPWVRRGSST